VRRKSIASIAVAILIHQPLQLPSCVRAPCHAPPDYPVALRLAIVAGGLLAAGVIVAIGKYARRRQS